MKNDLKMILNFLKNISPSNLGDFLYPYIHIQKDAPAQCRDASLRKDDITNNNCIAKII